MTDQERSIMAELKAACETCVEEITDLLRRIPQPYIGEMSNGIRAARHLARRATGNAERGLPRVGNRLLTGFVFAPSVKEITPDPGASTEIGAE